MSDAAPDTAATTGAGGGAGATDAPAAEPAPAPAPAAATDEPTDDGDDDGKTSDGKAPEKPVTINGVEYVERERDCVGVLVAGDLKKRGVSD